MALVGTISVNAVANTAQATAHLTRFRVACAAVNKDLSGFRINTTSLFKSFGGGSGGGQAAGFFSGLSQQWENTSRSIQARIGELQKAAQSASLSPFDQEHMARMQSGVKAAEKNINRIRANYALLAREQEKHALSERAIARASLAEFQRLTEKRQRLLQFQGGVLSRHPLMHGLIEQIEAMRVKALRDHALANEAARKAAFARQQATGFGSSHLAGVHAAFASAQSQMAARLGANVAALNQQIAGLQRYAVEAQAAAAALRTLGAAANFAWAAMLKISKIGAVIGAVGGFLSIRRAAQTERDLAQFEVLVGNVEKARKLFADLRGLAKPTPLTFPGVSEAARMLLNYGVAVENIVPGIRIMGDITGANEEKMMRLAYAFGQTQSFGRLLGYELRQMIDAGFNPLKEISRQTGESLADLKDRMEAGGVSATEVAKAFQTATEAGGPFHGNLQRQTETVVGAWGKLKDTLGELGDQIGFALKPLTDATLERLTTFVEWLKDLNIETVQSVVKWTAFAGTLTTVLLVVDKLIVVFPKVIKFMRDMAKGSAILQSMTGPRGWAILAGSLVAAAAAAEGVDFLFERMEKNSAAVASNVADMEKGFSGLDNTIKSRTLPELRAAIQRLANPQTLGQQLETVGDGLDDLAKKMADKGRELRESLRSPWDKLYDDLREYIDLLVVEAITYDELTAKAQQLAKETFEATRAKRELDKPAKIGAAVRGTVEGFSAVQEAKQATQRHMEQDRRIAAERKQQLEQMRRVLEKIEENTFHRIEINEVDL